MEISRQSQTAGDNSQQFQLGDVTNLTIVNGITEERARDIYREMNQQTMALYTQDARDEALRRIGILEKQVLRRSEDVEGLLEAFADPAFQILLGEAQKRAAATERECDYNLLSELLVAHVQKGQNRTQKAGINRAVEVVSDIDSQALCALTVSHAVLAFSPVTGVTYDGLKVLDGLFNKLIYDELPSGKSWLDHLDVLGAIRWSTIGNMKKFREYYTSRLDGYSCAGIKRSSDDYQKAVDILAKANISSKLLVDNECLDGYVRLNLNSKRSIPTLAFFLDSQPIPLTSVQIDAVNNVWNLYTKEVQAKQDARDNFMKLLSSFDELVELEQWWDKIPGTFHVSQVGCVLAHTNAKRCDPRIPDLI